MLETYVFEINFLNLYLRKQAVYFVESSIIIIIIIYFKQ